ncbi:MAG: hypothetical protein E6K95_07135 [Thaumarchaeota archaeon]|nr:MAG: hypothetical protein E6K95_07135 [Nitrososphaerota archaeon]
MMRLEAILDPSPQGVTKRSVMMKSQMEESRTDEGNEEVRRAWPPKKEELEQLYLTQRLSAMKISRIYGLKYPNPKSGETMVLWYLKKYGIQRRDRAEHIRKVTDEMAEGWVRRYAQGESLKQVSGGEVSPVTVFLHLRKRGVQLRDKIEALIETNTKHRKTPFSGDLLNSAYLAGFVIGDCQVLRHGRAIRVRTGTTHPAMAELFEEVFGPFGFVHRYPKKSRLREFEWNLEVDLDRTFQFLERDPLEALRECCASEDGFWSFLAGFFDAEGSIQLHRKRGGIGFELQLTNTNQEILECIKEQLTAHRLFSSLRQQTQDPARLGGNDVAIILRLLVWRYADVRLLLERLPLRHGERIAKREIALKLSYRASEPERAEIEAQWALLIGQIKAERDRFVLQAKRAVESKITS